MGPFFPKDFFFIFFYFGGALGLGLEPALTMTIYSPDDHFGIHQFSPIRTSKKKKNLVLFYIERERNLFCI